MFNKKKKPLFEDFESTIRLDPVGETEKRSIPNICSWCNKIFKISKWEIESNQKAGVSHGMCSDCQDKYG